MFSTYRQIGNAVPSRLAEVVGLQLMHASRHTQDLTMTLAPIPDRLAGYRWYAPHLAWLASMGLTPRHDPGGAKPRRADLSDADLRGADLRDADLRGVDVRFADLRGAVLRGVDIRRAVLTGALRHPFDSDIPGWSVVDGRLVRVG